MTSFLQNASSRTLIGLFIVGVVQIACISCSAVQGGDGWYKAAGVTRDPEHRQGPLGNQAHDKPIDNSAFVGMPETYLQAVSELVESIVLAINAVPIRRHRFYERSSPKDYNPYPDGAHPVFDKDVTVPLVILPRPDAVKQWSVSKVARDVGWKSEKMVAEDRGSVYGRTLIFEPGKLSQNPTAVPASPIGWSIPSWDLYTPDQDSRYFLDLQKLVVAPSYYQAGDRGNRPNGAPKDESAELYLGEKKGAKLLGELTTTPAYLKNSRLRWASIAKSSGVRRFLAYSLVDGNGALPARRRFRDTGEGPISPYVRRLICSQHQPRIKQHDELLLPFPLAWAPNEEEQIRLKLSADVHEEWCLDDWFPAQKDACWVIREAEDSKPLQESFLLMPASEKSDRPVFFIALFAETEPKQLVKELASLYNVPPETALDSPVTMAKLNALYEKVRDFPLGK